MHEPTSITQTRKEIEEQMVQTHLKAVLQGMIRRCPDTHQDWKDNPQEFVAWALNNGWHLGYETHRIIPNGIYSPDNCKPVTKSEHKNIHVALGYLATGKRTVKVYTKENPRPLSEREE